MMPKQHGHDRKTTHSLFTATTGTEAIIPLKGKYHSENTTTISKINKEVRATCSKPQEEEFELKLKKFRRKKKNFLNHNIYKTGEN